MTIEFSNFLMADKIYSATQKLKDPSGIMKFINSAQAIRDKSIEILKPNPHAYKLAMMSQNQMLMMQQSFNDHSIMCAFVGPDNEVYAYDCEGLEVESPAFASLDVIVHEAWHMLKEDKPRFAFLLSKEQFQEFKKNSENKKEDHRFDAAIKAAVCDVLQVA